MNRGTLSEKVKMTTVKRKKNSHTPKKIDRREGGENTGPDHPETPKKKACHHRKEQKKGRHQERESKDSREDTIKALIKESSSRR